MSDPVVVVSPSGHEYRLGPAEIAAGRLADLEARGYKRREGPAKGPSKSVRSSESSKAVESKGE